MKKVLIIMVACILGMSHFCFSQEPEYSWGKTSMNKDLRKQIDKVFNLNDEGFVILRKFTDQRSGSSYSIESYDARLSLLETNSIDFNLGVAGAKYVIEDIQVAGSKVYAFVSSWLVSKGTHALTLCEIGLDGSVNALKDLDVISAKKITNKGSYAVSISPDGSKLGIRSEQPFAKKRNEKLKFTCYSLMDYTVIWSQEQELDWPSKQEASRDIQINNRGEIVLFQKFKEKAKWNYHLCATQDSNVKSYADLDLAQKQVVDFQLTLDSADNHVLFGLYTLTPSELQNNVHGTCFYKVGAGLSLESKQVRENDAALLNYFVGDNSAVSDKKAVSDLTIKDILLREDGNLMVLLEQHIEDEILVQDSYTVEYAYDYIYGDFLTLNLSPEGDLVWWQAFSKNQHIFSNLDKDDYGSYLYYLKNDRLHVLWNNTPLSVPSIPPAYWREADGTKYVKNEDFSDKTLYATFMEIIEPDGTMDFSYRRFGLPLFNLHAGTEFGMSMSTRFSFEMTDKLVIMASTHNGGKRYRFGFVGL